LVHVGVAISRINEVEAIQTLKHLEEIVEMGELERVDYYFPKK